jgi:hypothetical protein
MFTDGCMNYTAVEENLGCICNTIEHPQRLFILVVVITAECLHPGLYLLYKSQSSSIPYQFMLDTHLLQRHGGTSSPMSMRKVEEKWKAFFTESPALAQ